MKNSTIVLLTFISTFITFSLIGNTDVANILYLSSIFITIIYGTVKGEVNITHISLAFMIIYLFEYITVDLMTKKLITLGFSKVSIATIHFSFQIVASLIAAGVFIFRVQLSRKISKSSKVSLTLFDGITPWVYIYMTFLLILTALEYAIDYNFGYTKLSFIYDYYPILIYVAMSAVVAILLSMVICHEKDLKRQSTNVE